jgi:cyclic beta-1,2-glucan synthetase
MTDKAWEIITAIDPARICSEGSSYLGEPYFLSGDVCGGGRHKGRCGWSIYTGSAGWFFSAVFAVLLGIRITGDCFTVDPKLTPERPSYRLTFTHLDTVYTVKAEIGEENKWVLDGKNVGNLFYFDKNRHYLEITVEISKEMR